MLTSYKTGLFCLVLICGLIFFSVLSTTALETDESDLPTTSGWRGFFLDISLPEEIIKVLGKPKTDKSEIIKSTFLNNWTAIKKGRSARRLVYKKIGRYDTVEFIFREDRLAAIGFELKQNTQKGLFEKKSTVWKAGNVPDIFQTDFLMVLKVPKQSKITDYEGQKEPTIPKVYPALYSPLGINNKSVVWIAVENSSIKSQWKTLISKPTIELFPGFVQGIVIVSRSEN